MPPINDLFCVVVVVVDVDVDNLNGNAKLKPSRKRDLGEWEVLPQKFRQDWPNSHLHQLAIYSGCRQNCLLAISTVVAATSSGLVIAGKGATARTKLSGEEGRGFESQRQKE